MSKSGSRIKWILAAALASAGPATALDWQQCTEQTAPNIAASSAVAQVEDRGNVTVMELSGSYARGDQASRQAVAQAFYGEHPDNVDFLIVFTTFEFPTGDALAFNNAILNDTDGIGIPRFDNSAAFGSAEHRLQGYVDMAAMSRYAFAATDPAYKHVLDTLAHEVMHRWAAKVRYRTDGANGADSTGLLGRDGAHWNYFLDTDASVMLGSDWRARGIDTFEAIDVRHRYSPLDLYLAGFAAENEVPDMTLIVGGTPGSAEDVPHAGAVVTGTAVSVNIGQIVEASGHRSPLAENAQRDFRAALVLLKRPGEQVSAERLLALEQLRLRFQQRFSQMTQGRANFRIGTERKLGVMPVAAPVLVGSGAPTSSLPGINGAIVWLENQQRADGHWQDRPATAVRDTTIALSALSATHPEFGGLAKARAWLSAQSLATVEKLGTRVASTVANNTDLPVLLQARNTDAGWGSMAEWSSSAFDTAIAARALAAGGHSAEISSATLQLVVARQDANGGFGIVDGGATRLLSTLRGAEVLHLGGAAFDGARSRAAQWVGQHQRGNGGFGDVADQSSLADSVEVFMHGRRIGVDPSKLELLRTHVDQEQQRDGDWGGSVYLTALAVLAKVEDQQANIAVAGNLQLTPVQPRDGDVVTLSATVVNRSHLPVGSSRAQWFRGDPRQGGLAIGNPLSVPALGGFEQTILRQTWDTTGLTGDQTLWVQIDVDAAIAESSESDNFASLAVHVEAPSAAPDLALDANQISLDPAMLGSLPVSVHVRGSVRNLGSTGAPSSKLRLLGVRGSGDIVLAESDIGVAARSSSQFDLAFTATADTPLRLAVIADADGVIAESREDNNRADLQLSSRSSLDLSIDSTDLTLSGGASVGHDAHFRITLHNRGTTDSPATLVNAKVVQGNSSFEVFNAQVAVAAGASVSRDVVWRAGAAGAAELRVDIDPNNSVAEDDEGNNHAVLPFEVTLTEQADLAIVEGSLAFQPEPALQGGALVVSLRARNQGSTAAGAFAVGVYLRDPALGGAPLSKTTVPGLAAGAETTVVINVPTLPDGGDIHFYAVVDSDAQITEADETNNRAVGLVHVLGLPDAAVSATDITLNPSLPVPGQPVQATVRVHNLGGQSAQAIAVRMREGSSGSAHDVAPVQTIAVLAAGATAELSWNWTLGADVRQVSVALTPGGALPDAELANNAATLPFDVQNGDAFTSERYISPDGDGVRDAAVVVFRLPAGVQAPTVEVRDGRQHTVRHFANLLARGDGRVQVTWDGRDDDGRLAADGDYRVLALDSTGHEQRQAMVTVDLNRSSVLEATGTRHGLVAPLPDGVQWQEVPPGAGFEQYAVGVSQRAVYRTSVLAPFAEEIVSFGWAERYYATHPPQGSGFAGSGVSPDGSTIVFSLATTPGHVALFRTRIDQRDAPQLLVQDVASQSAYDIRFFDADEALVCVGYGCQQRLAVDLRNGATRVLDIPGTIEKISAEGIFFSNNDSVGSTVSFVPRAGGQAVELVHSADYYSVHRWEPSPSGTYLAVLDRDAQQERVWLVRAHDGTRRLLHASARAWIEREQGRAEAWRLDFAWLAIEKQFAVFDAAAHRVLRFDEQGTPLSSAGMLAISRKGEYQGYNDASWVEAFDVDDDGFQCRGNPLQYDAAAKRHYLATHEFGAGPNGSGTGITQFQSVSFAGDVPEQVAAWSSVELTDPSDQAAYPQHGCGVPESWPVWMLSDGSRIRADGRVDIPSTGVRSEPWEKSAQVQRIASDEKHLWLPSAVFSSMLNESAALRITPLGRGAQLFGIAADRNFAYYEIDWADDDATGSIEWHTVVPPSTEEVLSDEFLIWVPPQPGHYRVRLRVTDLAGNVATAFAHFNSQDESAIESVQVTPRYISPNGDGVQDSAHLNFRVRQPISLAAEVLSQEGAVVRHITRTYGSADVGQQTVEWDGRNEQGNVVPDGRYRIQLEGFSFPVTVDSRLPKVEARLRLEFGCDRSAFVHCIDYFVDRRAADQNLERLTVEAESDSTWSEIATYEPSLDHLLLPEQIEGKSWQQHELGFAAIVGRRLRVVATDLAGNRDSVMIVDQPRLVPFAFAQGSAPAGSVISDEDRKDYRATFEKFDDLNVLVADATGDVQELFVETAPRAEGEQAPPSQWAVRTQIAASYSCRPGGCESHTDGHVFDLPLGLPPQTEPIEYWVRVRGRRANNSMVYSDAVSVAIRATDTVPPDGGGEGDVSSAGEDRFLVGVMRQACGTGPSNRLLITSGFTHTGTTPSHLELSYRYPSNADWVATPIQDIAVSGKHRIRSEWDTAALPEGEVHLKLEAIQDGVRRLVGENKHVPIIHSSSQVELYSPATGARVCPSGIVEGSIRSLGAVAYELHKDAGLPASPTESFGLGESQEEGVIAPAGGNRLGELASFRILNPVDTASLRIEATNWSGATTCAVTTVQLDRAVEIVERRSPSTLLSNGRLGISAVGDTRFRSARAYLKALEELHVSASIQRTVDQYGDYLPSGAVVRELLDADRTGEFDLEWDGKDAQGQRVADDVYALVLRMTDHCGNRKEFHYLVDVDSTPPAAIIEQPQDNAVLHAPVVGVSGSVGDRNLAAWSLIADVGPQHLAVPIAVGSYPVLAHGQLGLFARAALAGPAVLKLSASDELGNKALHEVSIQLSESDFLIGDARAQPGLFSPNGDGRVDSTRVALNLLRIASTDVDVLDGSNVVVRSLSHDALLPVGSSALVWDGRGGSGAALPDGRYTVRIVARDPSTPGYVEQASAPVELDTVAPAVEVLSPATALAAANTSVVVRVDDANLQSYRVELSGANGVVASAEGTLSGTRSLTSLSELPEGDYRVRLTATDRAGNSSNTEKAFVLDRTPPQVSLLAPAQDAVLPNTRATTIRGSASDTHFASYKLDVSPASGGAWTTLTSGTQAIGDATLLSWMPQLPDGRYRLRLSAEDTAGNRAESLRDVEVDGTPPVAQITQPVDQAYVTGTLDLIGSADDAHLVEFRVDIATPAQAAAGQWSTMVRGDRAVAAARLASLDLVQADGDYVLRLSAKDAVELISTAQVHVHLDKHAPPTPLSLAVQLESGRDALLQWNTVDATDLAGYTVYRDGVRINSTPLQPSSYRDVLVPEGRHRYEVRAIDVAGNESAPSNAVQVLIDRTPPIVSLVVPAADARIGGSVDVIGTAYSSDDFKEFRLSAVPIAPPGPTVELRRSSLPLQVSNLATWNTSGIPVETQFRLHLEAEDTHGNVATSEVDVVVDNQAPAAPTGLHVALQGLDANVDWNANNEFDLLGYLLYRDGQPVNAPNGVLPADLRALALPDDSYLDREVPDGSHEYVVYAIDRAGNRSPPSIPFVLATVENGAPHLTIVQPTEGAQFEDTLSVIAVTQDRDLAEARFSFRRVGDSAWTALGDALTVPPYRVQWAPGNLPYAEYEIRAVGTDTGGNTDAQPSVVRVRYADLTAPDVPTLLRAHAEGHDVVLEWQASHAADTAGYQVWRRQGDSWSRINSGLVSTTSYVDTGLGDGDLLYYVVAVDGYGNASRASNEAQAYVFTLSLPQPYSPVSDASVALDGASPRAGAVRLRLDNAGNTSQIDAGNTATDGAVHIGAVPLAQGSTHIVATVTDSAGNVSVPGEVWIERGAPPSAPTGVQAEADNYEVTTSWATNPETDIVGYRVFRDDHSVLGDALTGFPVTVQSLSACAAPENVVDGNIGTTCEMDWYQSTSEATGPGLVLEFDHAHLVSSVQLDWASPMSAASGVDLLAWSGQAWITVAQRTGALTDANEVLIPTKPYRTDKLKLVVRGGSALAWFHVALAEVTVRERQLLTAPPLVEQVMDGHHTYQVTAVNVLGFESARSVAVGVNVGDAVGPDPVVLSGVPDGSDAHLSWTASVSPDVARYVLFRNGSSITEVHAGSPLSYTDTNLANGTYHYMVRAYDTHENASIDSNRDVLIAVSGPVVPHIVSVTAPVEGAALDIAWAPGQGTTPARYTVRRSATEAGPYVAVATQTGFSLRDRPLINGTRYYYTVEALDIAGNGSGQSAPASGVPLDMQSPEPPVLTYPTVTEQPLTLDQASTMVCGLAEPAAQVQLRRNEAPLSNVMAAAQDTLRTLSFSATYAVVVPSPDGRQLYVSDDFQGARLVATSDAHTLSELGAPADLAVWSAGGALYSTSSGSDVIQRRDRNGAIASFTQPFHGITALAVNADETAMLLLATYDSGSGAASGLWSYDVVRHQARRIGNWTGTEINPHSLRFAPGSTRAAFVTTGKQLHVVDLRTYTMTMIVADAAAPAEWSTEGRYLGFTRDGDARKHVWTYEPATARLRDALVQPDAIRALTWRPDALGFAVLSDSAINTYADDGNAHYVAGSSYAHSGATALHWTASGLLLAWRDAQALSIAPAGWFCLDGVSLAAGTNRLGGVAQDASGNVGLPASPVTVTRPAGTLPDLAVVASDIGFVPAAGAPGETFAAIVTVRNLGAVPAPAAEVRFTLTTPDGTATHPVAATALRALAAGEAQTLSIDFGTLSQVGAHAFRVELDPRNLVADAERGNNRADAVLTVASRNAPALTVGVTRASYAPDAVVQGEVSVTNTAAAPFSGRLRIAILDSSDVVAQDFGDVTVTALAFGVPLRQPVSWNATVAGSYRVRAQLTDRDGVLLASAYAPFVVETSRVLDLRLRADPLTVTPGQGVTLDTDLAFLAGNASLSGCALNWSVRAADTTEVWNSTLALGTLQAGYSLHQAKVWPGTLITGAYRGAVRLSCPVLERVAEVDITVQSTQVAIEGSVSIEPTTPLVAGSAMRIRHQLHNTGSSALTGVQWRLRVLRALDQPSVADTDGTVDLAASAVSDGVFDFAAANPTLGNYSAVLEAHLAGDVVGSWRALAQTGLVVADGLPPEITVLQPADAQQPVVVPAVVPLSAKVIDRHSVVAGAEVSVDRGAWQPILLRNDGTFGRGLAGLGEGAHSLSVRARDSWNNEAQSSDRSFIIDATPPSIGIAGINDGDIVNHTVTPAITVEDAHLVSSEVLLNGAPFASGSAVAGERTHVLSVHATDAAGNQATRVLTFVIDTTAPVVSIASPADGATLYSAATDVDVRSEPAAHLTLDNGAYHAEAVADPQGKAVFTAVPLAVGGNTLSAKAVDRAGNASAPASVSVTYRTSSLTGALIGVPASIARDAPLPFAYSLHNSAPNALTALSVRVELRALDAETALANTESSVDIAANGDVADNAALTTTGIAAGDYRVMLLARASGSATWQTLDQKTTHIASPHCQPVISRIFWNGFDVPGDTLFCDGFEVDVSTLGHVTAANRAVHAMQLLAPRWEAALRDAIDAPRQLAALSQWLSALAPPRRSGVAQATPSRVRDPKSSIAHHGRPASQLAAEISG